MNYKRLNVNEQIVEDWTAFNGTDVVNNETIAGSLPVGAEGEACKFVTMYRGRLVLWGLRTDPQNWFMSAVMDSRNWDYSPPTARATQAVAGNASDAGKLGDILLACCPYSDDNMILGGDHTLWIMRGDPAAGGGIDNIRLEDPNNARQCILVLMGATAEGKKELIAIADGYRESEQSWKQLLLDVKQRGLTVDPKLAIGDGALGFWKALGQVYPGTRIQRCWVHKTANILNEMPKSIHGQAKDMIHEIWMADAKPKAEKAFDRFIETFQAKYPKAVTCLIKDRHVLLTFYDFPAEHWKHIRTTNPIESTFATVRLRTHKTKGSGSRIACLTMVFKLVQSAQKRWRALDGSDKIPDVIAGVEFTDGVLQSNAA